MLVVFTLFASSFQTFSAYIVDSDKPLIIVIDPGHGGDEPGACYKYNGIQIKEKDLNIKIANYIRDELKNYTTPNGKDIIVKFTYNNPENGHIYLLNRVKYAKNEGADFLISLHNNASVLHHDKGSTVLVTSSHYGKMDTGESIYDAEERLANLVLDKLSDLGLKNNGLLRKYCTDDERYPNGDLADWYSIICFSMMSEMPSILIEHAHMDYKTDYYSYLSTDEQLQKLAVADTLALVDFYGLVKK